MKCNDWEAVNVIVTLVEVSHRPITGRYLFPQLEISLTQTKQVSNVNQN